MNRYRLAKTYPGSPPLGTIIVENFNSLWWDNGSNAEFTKTTLEDVKNSPEFWLPEDQWEVISELTNSPIGSSHWLRSLLSGIKNVGSLMQKERNITSAESPFDRFKQEWGKDLVLYTEEILKHFEGKLK